MIYFDITKSAAVRHRSGLARLNERLRVELGADAQAVTWSEARERAKAEDWFVTCELFSDAERPGFGEFIRSRRCRTAAIFADAIPIKLPHITWPHSVGRHPHYMKRLADFDWIWAISAASRDELSGYWNWLGIERPPPIEVLPLGADFDGRPRVAEQTAGPALPPSLLCVGILEPRKNQEFLVDVCAELWGEGVEFELHIVGRVNPHFGRSVERRIGRMRQRFRGLRYHAAARDEVLAELFATVRATVLPTIAEGCGLPLLESLWRGVPCVCSDLPVLRENADDGGCLAVDVNDAPAWREALRRVLTDEAFARELGAAARSRPLPTWAEAAGILRAGLR